MRSKKTVFAVIIIILAAIMGFLGYSGLFSKIVIMEKEMGPYQMVYINHAGSYMETGKVMLQILDTFKKENIEPAMGFGMYYDDPKKTHVEDLRSDVGCILKESDYHKIPGLKKNFKIRAFPKTKSVVCYFPFRNIFSIYLGVARVYPNLGAYLTEKKYKNVPVMEIYDKLNGKIIYTAAVKK